MQLSIPFTEYGNIPNSPQIPNWKTPNISAFSTHIETPEISDTLFEPIPIPDISENLVNDPRIANTLASPE